jgi:GT2 family glycosyltransferase
LLIDSLYQQFEAAPSRQRFFTSNNMAGARETLMSLGGFSGSFPFAAAEDRDLCDRWVEAGGELVYVSDALVDHFHEMSLDGFLAQHFRCGRGARVLYRRRARRGLKFRVNPLSFYVGMLISPFRAARLSPAIRLAGPLCLAQLCNAAGYLYEAPLPMRRSGTTEFEARAASPLGG